MELKLKDAASFLGGKLTGNGELIISGLAKIEEAKTGDLTFLYLPAYEKHFPYTKASAIIVKNGFDKSRDDISYIELDEPNKAFFKLIKKFFTPEIKLSGIHQSAYIYPNVETSENLSLGRNVVISEGCKIGKNVKIFHNTVIHNDVVIGDDCLIYSNVTIREGSVIGNRCIIHSGTVIGADGFGFEVQPDKSFVKVPQIGNVVIEDDVEIGSNSTIDRASLGSTVIGKGSKIDNLVQIAHNVELGKNTIISAQAGISGSTKVGDNCYILGQVGITGHVEIADDVILIAQAGVSKSITKAGKYFGSPAKELKNAFQIEAHIRNLPSYSEKLKTLEKELKELKEKLDPK